jgi:putative ABC transport system permease protein
VLVGILEGDPAAGSGASVRLGFVSDEYLNSHELYAFRTTALLVAAREGRKDAVDDYLETTIHSRYAEVETFALIVEFLKAARVGIYVIFGAVNSVVSIAIALVVGIINRIAIGRRLGEFGLLHALGRRRGQLIRRMTLETATVAGAGSLVGLGVALLIMQGLKGSLFYDLGMELNVLNPSPFYFVLPIPLITVALTMLSVRRTFARLDAVAIVERGKLSEESKERRAVKRSSARPLSFHTFYLRHRRRGVLMVLGAALMILGVTLPVFLLSGMTSAMEPYMDYLQHVSIISPVQAGLDPGVVGQVRSHPAVERTMPVMSFAVQMVLPPSGGTDIKVFGVAEADLPVLLELFGVQVQQGRLPRPRSNDIVLSSAVAANRGLEVGDVIGGEVETGGALVVDNLPTEMVVAGILSPDRPWIGLVSYEFLQSHELTSSQSPRLLVIPREGEKQALDRWLETGVDSTQTHIITYGLVESEYRQMTASIILVFALLECMIAVVAAVALATLNHIFFAQRREEFGILNAIGRGRRWLVSRTMKETGSVIGVAWIIGAALCGVCLLCWQAFVYAPRGLVIDFGNPAPWLLTLPIPLAAALASVGAVAWVLSRLDPVAVVERRE